MIYFLEYPYVTTAQIQQEGQCSCTVGLGRDGVKLSGNTRRGFKPPPVVADDPAEV
ncbi:hypothetical protein [Oscillatoria sp. HE19RPO]|uniref:hypothetical protein n=1 Tax=Oscillatoria sp. HE19RPO TaxID=2954806 RepID=UPI0020C31ECC|nr:hypothetical protein [Oscillatoria sp. HE19RPO]